MSTFKTNVMARFGRDWSWQVSTSLVKWLPRLSLRKFYLCWGLVSKLSQDQNWVLVLLLKLYCQKKISSIIFEWSTISIMASASSFSALKISPGPGFEPRTRFHLKAQRHSYLWVQRVGDLEHVSGRTDVFRAEVRVPGTGIRFHPEKEVPVVVAIVKLTKNFWYGTNFENFQNGYRKLSVSSKN